jgi:hypothetical protein
MRSALLALQLHCCLCSLCQLALQLHWHCCLCSLCQLALQLHCCLCSLCFIKCWFVFQVSDDAMHLTKQNIFVHSGHSSHMKVVQNDPGALPIRTRSFSLSIICVSTLQKLVSLLNGKWRKRTPMHCLELELPHKLSLHLTPGESALALAANASLCQVHMLGLAQQQVLLPS